MRLRILTVAAALVLAAAGHGWAQETTGSIAGRVTDAQGLAVPGAAVTVTGTQGTQTFTSDAQGRFNAPFLTPGTYTVRAELQGFKAIEQKNVVVRLGQRVDLPLTMEVGGLTETVEVTSSSPIIDTATTTVGAVINADLLQRVPIGRRFSDALYIAPGVVDSGAGAANPSIAGGSGLENQYVVDGVNITNTGYGALGSYSIYHGSLGNGVTYDFVNEIQVKTAGYEAEYGQSTGGVVNVLTKSGSNDLRGSLFGYFQPSGLEAGWKQVQTENGAINTAGTQTSDAGFTLGGPIVPDRLFFFGAYNPSWETRSITAPAGFPLESLGEVDRDRHINSYSGKVSAQIANGHRLDATFFGDPAKGDMGPQRLSSLVRTDTSAFSSLEYGGHNQTVKYDGVIRPSWLVEASVSRARNNLIETPSSNTFQITDTTVVPNIVSGGIGFYEAGNEGTNLQYQAKSTHIFGGHQIRYGVLYEDIQYDNINQYTGPTFTLSDGQVTSTGATVQVLADANLGQIYRATRANLNPGRSTTQHYVSFFVQDTWRIGNRLTVRPGIRYEQQKLIGTLADFTWDGNWAPRIGATYDIIGNGRSKIFANWGRYFAKVPNDLAARALSADAGVTRADYYDAALTQPIPDGVPAGPNADTRHLSLAGLHPSDFDPNSKSTYLDETLVGMEFEPITNLNLGVRWVHRRFGRILEDVGTVPMTGFFLPLGCGGDDTPACIGDTVEYFITNPGPNTPVVPIAGFDISFEDAIHEYDAIEVTADKRFGNNWGLQASYRWSRLWGTFEGFFRNDNGQSDPAITSLFDFPTNDPSYTAIGVPELGFRGDIRYLGSLGAGPLPTDRPHQFKVYGNYSMNWGLNLGAGVQVSSGIPLTALAANPYYENEGEIPEGPRGSGIQTVDGFKTRTPYLYDVNLHGDYAVRLGGARRIVLLADLFNLFNVQRATGYDQDTESTFGALNPDYGQPVITRIPQFQTPFQIRFGARFEF
jgi:hypothetical protein